ncbi:GNAT family N-acetyltransferase [Pontivivens ytuae]|uniref:GNAT family N-acetyltransferase n=1 Tax=Pontivivens ytuae TaxID=2789856 RepID=A0A7S9LP44_9RHOB|nr:GNAT family N-acetyltransferase [Pontivivens ytuae]QPH52633.1 GNAT family N-acetyltransferase [Pontivivens ytuae]
MIDADALADLHARCFTDGPRPWTAREFADFDAAPEALILTAPGALAVAQQAGDEAELLTIAVAPEARGQGRATGLLADMMAELARRGARFLFLEVAADNAAARALYASASFTLSGQRKGYYRRGDGRRVDALVLSRHL